MGRLGFNIGPKKEAAAVAEVKNTSVMENVEKGISNEQNERNETLEVSELVMLIDERNQTIKNLRLLLASLTIVIVCLTGYVCLTQARFTQSDQEVVEHINKMQAYTQHIQNLQGQFEAAAKLQQAVNCSRELSLAQISRNKLKHDLETEKSERTKEREESSDKYRALLESFETLQSQHEASSAQCLSKETELQAQLGKLQRERAELVAKNEESGKKIQELSSQQRSASQKRTTAQPTTTTAAPTRRNLFDSKQFRRFNDIVKEIDSLGRAVGNVFSDMF